MNYQRQEEILSEARKALYHHGFTMGDPIGDGGFATIYKVQSRQYNENFAVKLIDLSIDETSSLPASFEAEINALINLCHPNVIKIYDHFCSESCLYIILEFCPGGSIKDLIDKDTFIRPPHLYEYCGQILSALLFCHQRGVAHRDVKPSNILLDKYGRAKLADFGLAQHFNHTQLSKMFGGSLPYLAPEILKKKPFDPMKADVWALGITFFEMAAGHLPFKAETPEQLKKEISMNAISTPSHFQTQFIAALKLMLNAHPSHRCTMEDVLMLPIFQKTKLGRQTKSLSKSDAPPKRMAPISSSAFLAKSSTARRTCLYAKKRFFSVPPQPTFVNDVEEPPSEFD